MPRSTRVKVEDDDYTEDEPRPRSRRTRDEEDDEPRPRSRRRRDDDDDADDEPRPRSRSRKTDDDDADDEPRPRKRSRSRSDEESESDSDGADALVIPTHRGRDEIKKNRPVGEGGDAFFRWDDDDQVVKFLDTEPWSYDQHWVKRQGKQSFPCVGPDNGCPLCEIGVKVAQKVVYSLVNLSHSKGPLTQTLEVGPTLDDTLYEYDQDRKTGPLPRLYWALHRTEKSGGGRSKYQYFFTPIKERDLEEDWEIPVEDADAAVEEAEVPSRTDVLGKWTLRDLQAIADEAMGR